LGTLGSESSFPQDRLAARGDLAGFFTGQAAQFQQLTTYYGTGFVFGWR